jgi:CRISPR-associated protein Cmr2
MRFDYYASLAEKKPCPELVNEGGLAAGFVDGCSVWSCRDGEKNNARQCYMKRVVELELNLPPDLHLEPDHASLPDSNWFAIDVSFTLKSPWYSKDDRPFHVLDNPVRKDRVFGAPFMSAASWKGLLRWACRMQVDLSDHLEKHDMKMGGWKDPFWIVHLFGNEKGKDEDFRSGALVFCPTWFNRVGFEVINPHSRTRRAGTQPIYYEVVPAGTKGRLRLLYAPLPGELEHDQINPADFIGSLVDSIKALLEIYGISAKRTAGWGTARIDDKESKLRFVEGGSLSEVISRGTEAKQFEPPKEEFGKLMNREGEPISTLLGEGGKIISKTQFKKLEGNKPCTNNELEEFRNWYERYGGEYKKRLKAEAEYPSSLQTRELPFDKLIDALKQAKDSRQGGDQ